jgi:anti-sigma factor ChrR (cupin superfamily)
MSAPPDMHGEPHSELVCLHALQALPPSEVAIVETQIAACAQCRQEMAALRPIIDSFVSWPTDVLRPSPALWERLAQRVAADKGKPLLPTSERWVEPAWEEMAPGILCKLLATDTQRDRVSMLVRLEPGVEYPPHRHAGVEELYLLHGELWIDDKKLHPGDYNRAEVGSRDGRVWSETGCTCVLITSPRDVLG